MQPKKEARVNHRGRYPKPSRLLKNSSFTLGEPQGERRET